MIDGKALVIIPEYLVYHNSLENIALTFKVLMDALTTRNPSLSSDFMSFV